MRLCLCLLSSLVFISFAQPLAAQSSAKQHKLAQAKKAFEIGTDAYEHGKFRTALKNFELAYELTKSPDLLYNIATVNDRMRRDSEALDAYQAYLKARPESPDRVHIKGRIRILRASIRARQQAEKEAKLEAERAAKAAAERVRAERPLTQRVSPGPGPWITIGTSSAVMVTGAVFLGLGQRDINKVENADSGSTFSNFDHLRKRGPKRAKTGIALLSTGLAGGLGGMIWQLTGWKEERIPEVSIGPRGIAVKGQF